MTETEVVEVAPVKEIEKPTKGIEKHASTTKPKRTYTKRAKPKKKRTYTKREKQVAAISAVAAIADSDCPGQTARDLIKEVVLSNPDPRVRAAGALLDIFMKRK